MKKLLVAAMGAAVAIGAFAATPVTALRFESATVGDSETVSQLNTLHGGTYWSDTGSADNAYAIEAAGNVTSPMPLGNVTKSLNVKTKFGNPLSVNVVDEGEAQTIGTDGIYFDSLVKFTVCDDVPSTDYDGAKIVMWLQEDEAAGETNLYVNAGYLSYDGSVQVSNAIYKCGNIIGADFADAWHRVTIKAIADITTDATVDVPGFAIFIDGSGTAVTRANSGDEKWDSSFTGQFTFAEAVEKLVEYDALFPSLDQTSGNKLKMSKASFDGTGSITDIAFYDVSPEAFADDYVSDKATVTIGQLVQPFTSLAAAVTYVNDLQSGDVTFALSKGMELSDTLAFESAANVTFDFAGFVLTNTSASAVAISNAGASLTLTNSTGNVGGIYCADDGAAVSQAGTGALVIGGGVFNGDVDFEEALDVTVTGGSFKNDETYFETGERESGTWIADGKKLQLNEKTDLYDVVDFVPVAQIEGGAQYETLAEAVAAATAGQTVTVLANCEVTAPITFSVGIVVSNDYTISTKAAYTLRFANGNTPVTICGNGEIVWDAGAGSPLLVGNNEATAKQTNYGISGVYAGSLILNGGTIRTGAVGDGSGNMIKVENGSFVMNGGEVSGKPTRCIKADAEAGDATATVVINGGVISNTVVTKYDGTSLQPVALNASAKNSGTASITVNGGQITGTISGTVTIPGASTAQFDRDQTAFCVADYKTVLSDGWYVVAAKVYYTAVSLNKATTSIETNLTETLTATFTPASAADDTYTWTSSAPAIATVDQNGVVTAVAAGEATITVTATHDSSVTASCTVTVTAPSVGPAPLDPSDDKEETVVEAASSEAAIEAVTITPPAGSGAQAGDYKSLFTYDAQPAGDGQYTVTITGIQEAVKQGVATDAAKVLDGTSNTVTVPAGLYYKVTTMTNLDGTGTTTIVDEGLSTGTDVNVSKPGTTQGFIKVEMGTKAID